MKLLIIVFAFIATGSFAQQKEFSWLLGTWKEEGKQAFEVWKNGNGFLSAESFKMDGDKKIVTEEIKLIKKGNDFYYVPDVAGPQGAVEFKITSFDKNSFVAENPQHDFPKMIAYRKTDDTHIKASIGDGSKTIDYLLTKVK
ncbi:MAG: DUF6265 family protein [Cyclobacteriaceae bacterium]